jgi:hypothetical protein
MGDVGDGNSDESRRASRVALAQLASEEHGRAHTGTHTTIITVTVTGDRDFSSSSRVGRSITVILLYIDRAGGARFSSFAPNLEFKIAFACDRK